VTVRPLRQITGHSHFSELFLDEVRIPKSNLVGEKNKGWTVAKATLSNERSGLAGVAEIEKHLSNIVKMAASHECGGGRLAVQDPLFRSRLARLYSEKEAIKYLGYRTLTAQARGADPGSFASIGKLLTTELRQRMMALALYAEGPEAQVMKRTALTVEHAKWQMFYLDGRAYTIGGGTSEIMRNIIAERILGLPHSSE
jgi:alkylation response protein AidB-like acyl-CoA dehydrogenase